MTPLDFKTQQEWKRGNLRSYTAHIVVHFF